MYYILYSDDTLVFLTALLLQHAEYMSPSNTGWYDSVSVCPQTYWVYNLWFYDDFNSLCTAQFKEVHDLYNLFDRYKIILEIVHDSYKITF